MTHLPRRVLGACLLLVLALSYDATSAQLVHRLVLPAIMALGAWLVVQNLGAVLLAVAVLAAARSDLDSPDRIAAQIYPAVCLLAALGLAAIAAARFRERIKATRAARWRQRSSSRQRPP